MAVGSVVVVAVAVVAVVVPEDPQLLKVLKL
jgi:hypothetical protein